MQKTCLYVKRNTHQAIRSGNVGVIVVEKVNGKMNELTTIGIARHQEEIDSLIAKGHKWMDAEQERRP